MSVDRPSLARARAVADAVLYEGYLLYPYRSSSAKNQVRWQFGVLGPPGAAEAAFGEPAAMAGEMLLRPGPRAALTVHLRFLQVQRRSVQHVDGTPVSELAVDDTVWLSWDEAVEHELTLGPFDLTGSRTEPVTVAATKRVEELRDTRGQPAGRIVRACAQLTGELRLSATADGPLLRLRVEVVNTAAPAEDRDDAIRRSFVGAHLLLVAEDGAFVSVIDPPPDALDAARHCTQDRCWPVLAGVPGEDGIVLAAPIILYDYPEIAEQSAGALFDSTEIDEILTLRVMTLTDEEKAQARATDPHAAAIIDQCEQMSAADMQRLHGILRDPHAIEATLPTIDMSEVPTFDGDDWWQANAAVDVSPETEWTVVAGRRVARGSTVRLRPSRRADAQDLFFAGQLARVSAVNVDLDGQTHVAVTLVDDPAAELHDWYGRYLYFAPDEIEPIDDTVESLAGGDQQEGDSA